VHRLEQLRLEALIVAPSAHQPEPALDDDVGVDAVDAGVADAATPAAPVQRACHVASFPTAVVHWAEQVSRPDFAAHASVQLLTKASLYVAQSKSFLQLASASTSSSKRTRAKAMRRMNVEDLRAAA